MRIKDTRMKDKSLIIFVYFRIKDTRMKDKRLITFVCEDK